jgi:hypothetical protein
VLRTCRADGVLVKPDLPLAALDRCFRGHGFFGEEPLVGETWSDHPAGRTVYLVTMNASRHWKERAGALRFRVDFSELGAARPPGPVVLYDWRRGAFEIAEADGGFDESLGWQEFGYRVLCPLLPGERALFGDVSKFATLGDRRVAGCTVAGGELRFDVLGAPGEEVTVDGFAASAPRRARRWTSAGSEPLEVEYERGTGRFRLRVAVGPEGIAGVAVGDA